jgi:hypothetical protein
MRVVSTIKMALIVFSFAAIATVSGLKVFESWSQVSTLWESEINPMQIIGHPHMPRYLVAYPGFLLEELLPSVGFSLYIAVFVALNFVLLRAVAMLAIHRRPSLATYLGFAAIHFTMNGRGAIAWAAWLFCIWICYQISAKITRPVNQLGWIAISCWFAAVSTGVFIVVTLAFSFVILEYLRSAERISLIRRVLALSIAAPLCYVLLEYFLIAFEKNIDFYGGGTQGAFNMLQHGLGSILFEINLLYLIILWFIACCAVLVVCAAILGRRFSLLERLIVLPLVGGLFGITVLTLVIPVLLLQIQGRHQSLQRGRSQSWVTGSVSYRRTNMLSNLSSTTPITDLRGGSA